jgi:hypothetical protein
MTYDERTAARIRAVLARRRDVVERKMFGGLTFMVNGAMCCGITAEALVVRVGPAAHEAALAEPHVRPMTFTAGPSLAWCTSTLPAIGPRGRLRAGSSVASSSSPPSLCRRAGRAAHGAAPREAARRPRLAPSI